MTLLSALILLAGALVRPRIHYRNGYICWSRCSVEALVNCKCQALMVDRKGYHRTGCMILRRAMQAQGIAILLEVDVCLGILGVPSAVRDRAWVISSRVRTSSVLACNQFVLTSTVVGS